MKPDDRTIDQGRSQPPLSVAFVTPGWPLGAYANGIIPYVSHIASGMRADGHTVTVLALYTKGEVDGVDVRKLRPFERPRSLASRALDKLSYRARPGLGERRAIVRAQAEECQVLIRERGLQLIEVEESHGWPRWLQDLLPIPVVVRIHGPWFVNGPLRGAVEDARFHRQVRNEGRALAEAHAISAPSLEVLERARAYYGLPMEQAEVIPLPVEMVLPRDRWSPERSEPGSVVFIGRFDRHKGGDLVIDAFAEVARHQPEARLRFVGPDEDHFVDDIGQPRTILEYIASRFPDEASSSRVEWLGARPSSALPEIRRQAGVVVVGSRYDNFPFTVLEAMAIGCPLVAPRVGGIPEMIQDGVNGLLFEAGNASDMAAQVRRLLDDRSLAAQLGRQAAIDCERRYDPAILAKRTEDYYRRVIGGWDPAGRKGTSR